MLPFLKTISAASGADWGFALTDASESSATIRTSAVVFMFVTFYVGLVYARALFHSRPGPSSKTVDNVEIRCLELARQSSQPQCSVDRPVCAGRSGSAARADWT